VIPIGFASIDPVIGTVGTLEQFVQSVLDDTLECSCEIGLRVNREFGRDMRDLLRGWKRIEMGVYLSRGVSPVAVPK
jgi:hypothetical protein